MFVMDTGPALGSNPTMNFAIQQPAPMLSIAAVERDCGLSKDALRVWERRYGFPQPQRDSSGERAYPLDQVERLRIVKRLLDAGHRPGQVVALPLSALQQLADATIEPPRRAAERGPGAVDLAPLLYLIRSHDLLQLRQELARQLARLGLRGFVTGVVAPLSQAVGDAWMRGELQIFEEHLYSEVAQSALRQALAAIPPPAGVARARVLLGTLPGEPHGLGLLMAEVLFALEGCACFPLGVQTPVLEIARAARALDVQIVALGFSACLNARQAQERLSELRAELPAGVQLWAGGAAPGLQRRLPEGVQRLDVLEQIPFQLRRGAAAN